MINNIKRFYINKYKKNKLNHQIKKRGLGDKRRIPDTRNFIHTLDKIIIQLNLPNDKHLLY
jgi:hypothetical protein